MQTVREASASIASCRTGAPRASIKRLSTTPAALVLACATGAYAQTLSSPTGAPTERATPSAGSSFCMSRGPESVVEVRTKTAVRFNMEPVIVEGRFAVLEDDGMGLYYRITDAVSVK